MPASSLTRRLVQPMPVVLIPKISRVKSSTDISIQRRGAVCVCELRRRRSCGEKVPQAILERRFMDRSRWGGEEVHEAIAVRRFMDRSRWGGEEVHGSIPVGR